MENSWVKEIHITIFLHRGLNSWQHYTQFILPYFIVIRITKSFLGENSTSSKCAFHMQKQAVRILANASYSTKNSLNYNVNNVLPNIINNLSFDKFKSSVEITLLNSVFISLKSSLMSL